MASSEYERHAANCSGRGGFSELNVRRTICGVKPLGWRDGDRFSLRACSISPRAEAPPQLLQSSGWSKENVRGLLVSGSSRTRAGVSAKDPRFIARQPFRESHLAEYRAIRLLADLQESIRWRWPDSSCTPR